MEPSQRDISHIQNHTNADKVTVTDSSAGRIQCDLLFIEGQAGTTVKAEFDLLDYDWFMETCERVRWQANQQLKLELQKLTDKNS